MMHSGFDTARIYVKGGKGGDGAVSFRREKFVPFGGPDGGDGGHGGSVYLVGDATEDTLLRFRSRPRFAAGNGGPGQGGKKHGPCGDDTPVQVPLGTVVACEGEQLGEITMEGQRLLVARGGMGGWGNARFATATERVPRFALRGEPGEEHWVSLELKLIADVGIIGYPNAGKSSLLRAVTRATPKVADYPFTTLQPNLGVAEVDGMRITLADLPGLIEGAHQGVGLGLDFLRHAERTRLLLHVVDGAAADPLADYDGINSELLAYGRSLPDKSRLVVVNKVDLPEVQERWPALQQGFAARGVEVQPVSALTGAGTREVLATMAHLLAAGRQAPREQAGEKVYRPEGRGYRVEREGGAFRVYHPRLERLARMVDPASRGAVAWFRERMARLGVSAALERQGVQPGDRVVVGNLELEW
ncbi:MAG: GTPase ObgE [Chloroflexi bacterium]|nr:GTPase ObgE [Chloroflexota bacterium]